MSGHRKSELLLRGGVFERQTRDPEPFRYSSASKRPSATGRASILHSPHSRHGATEENPKPASGSDPISISLWTRLQSPSSRSDIVHSSNGSPAIISQRSTTEHASSEHGCPAVSSQADSPDNTAEYIAANRRSSLRKALTSSFRTLDQSNGKTLDDEDMQEEMQIDAILRLSQTPPRSSTNHRNQVPSQRSLLISSPPHKSLFTPPSSPPRKNAKFSHIAVPPFPAGLSRRDYKPLRFPGSATKKPADTGTYVHSSISDALQAAMSNNASSSSGTGSSTHLDSRRDGVQSPGIGKSRISRWRPAQPNVSMGQADESGSRPLKRKRSQPVCSGPRSRDMLQESSLTQLSRSDAAIQHANLATDLAETRSAQANNTMQRPVTVIARSLPNDSQIPSNSRRTRRGAQAKRTETRAKFSDADVIPISSADERDQAPGTLATLEESGSHSREDHRDIGGSTSINEPSSSGHVATQAQEIMPTDEQNVIGQMNAMNATPVENGSVPQVSPNALQSAFEIQTTPRRTHNRHQSLQPAGSPVSNRVRPDRLMSPVARLKSGLLSSVVSSPGGRSNGKAVDRCDLGSPSYFQIFRSPSNVIADLELSDHINHDLCAAYDRFFDNLHQPGETFSSAAVGVPFETIGLIRSGQDPMLVDGINGHDTNEMFDFPLHHNPASPRPNLELQPTKADGSSMSASALDPFLSPHTLGGNLAVQDAIAHEDVREWFLDPEVERHPSVAESSTSEFSGSRTIDPSLLRSSLTEPLFPPSVSRSVSPESVTSKSGSEEPSTPPRPRASVETRKPSTRISRAPFRANMIATEEFIVSSDSDCGDEASSSSSEGSEVRPKHGKSGKTGVPGQTTTVKRLSVAGTESGLLPPTAKVGRPRKVNIPQSIGSELSCCHHCRRSTWREKMVCSGIGKRSRESREPCNKKWCDYCIAKHYPEIIFTSDDPTFICPWCHDTCRCSSCTRRRGEEYIGERPRNSTKKLLSTPSLPPPDPTFLVKATTFWGTVYGLTGERVGKAFIADDGDSRFVVTRPVTSTEIANPAKLVKRRMFVGKVQEWWGIKAFRDLEPVQNMTRMQRLNPSAVRFYIGDKSFLPARRRQRSPSPAHSFGGSELTDLSDEEGGAGIGMDKSEKLRPGVVSLGEVDVARAIAAAVTALEDPGGSE